MNSPDCPLCGHPAYMIVARRQAFCGQEGCVIFTWDASLTPAENMLLLLRQTGGAS